MSNKPGTPQRRTVNGKKRVVRAKKKRAARKRFKTAKQPREFFLSDERGPFPKNRLLGSYPKLFKAFKEVEADDRVSECFGTLHPKTVLTPEVAKFAPRAETFLKTLKRIGRKTEKIHVLASGKTSLFTTYEADEFEDFCTSSDTRQAELAKRHLDGKKTSHLLNEVCSEGDHTKLFTVVVRIGRYDPEREDYRHRSSDKPSNGRGHSVFS